MNRLLQLILAGAAALSSMSYAIAQAAGETSQQPLAVAESSAEMSEGEIRKVNKEAKKLTIRHGELKGLGMPPMTMVFRVADSSMLEKVREGDKVRFVADKIGGHFTVTEIEVKQ